MVEVLDETKQWPSPSALEQIFESFLSQLSLSKDLTVILCDDTFIKERNLEDRGLNEATDVLSYPMMEPQDVNMPEVGHLGDIFISVDTARRQAKEHNHSLTEEILTLAAHGLMHLRGFDHPTEEAWQDFHEAQKQILELFHQGPSHGDQ